MKSIVKKLVCVVVCLSSLSSGAATGYVNKTFDPGANVFGNPLNNTNNYLSSIMRPPPEGTSVSLWDAGTQQYPQTSFFLGGAWTIDLTLAPGTGAVLLTPAAYTNTFVGEILNADGSIWTGGEIEFPPPFSGPDGIYLWSSKWPAALGGNNVFTYIVGRDPQVGEAFWRYNGSGFDVSTYVGGGSWTGGAPTLSVSEAAFFNIGPVEGVPYLPVPEPGTLLLCLSGGVLCLLGVRQRRSKP